MTKQTIIRKLLIITAFLSTALLCTFLTRDVLIHFHIRTDADSIGFFVMTIPALPLAILAAWWEAKWIEKTSIDAPPPVVCDMYRHGPYADAIVCCDTCGEYGDTATNLYARCPRRTRTNPEASPRPEN